MSRGALNVTQSAHLMSTLMRHICNTKHDKVDDSNVTSLIIKLQSTTVNQSVFCLCAVYMYHILWAVEYFWTMYTSMYYRLIATCGDDHQVSF